MINFEEIDLVPKVFDNVNLNNLEFSNFIAIGFYPYPEKDGVKNVIKYKIGLENAFDDMNEFRSNDKIKNCNCDLFHIFELEKSYSYAEKLKIIEYIKSELKKKN